MQPKALDFLEDLQARRPELAADLQELARLHQRKLWHQLTLKLEACFQTPAFNTGDTPVQLYRGFISDFAHKINLLRLAQFAVHASRHAANPAQARELLQQAITRLEEMKDAKAAQPILLLKMHVAQHQLEAGEVAECKAALAAGREALEGMSECDPSVSAAVHYAASQYYKVQQDYAEFFKSAMMYLAFVSSDSLAADFKASLAVDVGLAALLGEGVYGFAQLLMHPIAKALQESPSFGWLHEMLTVFNAGDLHKYDELCARHASLLNSQPALVAHERRLREKITIACLIDLVSTRPAEDRCIALSDIAARTKLSLEGCELLLMKAMSLKLVEGVIDQVAGHVQVSWVQPRVLTLPQVAGLKERLDAWVGKVAAISAQLESESMGMVHA